MNKEKTGTVQHSFGKITSIAFILFAFSLALIRIGYDVLALLPGQKFLFMEPFRWETGLAALAMGFAIASFFKEKRVRWAILVCFLFVFLLTFVDIIMLLLAWFRPLFLLLTLLVCLFRLIWFLVQSSRNSNNNSLYILNIIAILSLGLVAIFVVRDDGPFRYYNYHKTLSVEGRYYYLVLQNDSNGFGVFTDSQSFLYECENEYFRCNIIYQAPFLYALPYLEGTALVYDESSRILRLTEAEDILFEYPIP